MGHGDDLKLLYGFLGDRGAHAVDGVVCGIGAVYVDDIRAAVLAADI